MKIHAPQITGSFIGNISGSSTSTGSFGHILKDGVNWDTAVSSSAATAGFGSGGGGGSSFTSAGISGSFTDASSSLASRITTREAFTTQSFSDGTATIISGSSTSTGSFGTYIGDGSQLTGISAGGFDYTSGSSPVVSTNPSSLGATWINTTSGEIFVAIDITADSNEWLGTAGTEVAPPVLINSGDRGVFSGDLNNNVIPIVYIDITTTGDAASFGELYNTNIYQQGACSNGTRGVFGGGYANYQNSMDYITIATTGDALDFGDLTQGREHLAGASNGARGVFAGGSTTTSQYSRQNTIDYITIATTGNATDFGDLTVRRDNLASAQGLTRALFAAGKDTSASLSFQNTIDYITIATTGNATDFGDLTGGINSPAGCSDNTTALFGGGSYWSSQNRIDYVTIATTANALDFGDLTVARSHAGAAANSTRGVFAGGYGSSANVDTIDYITIASTGNATDFGNLDVVRTSLAGLSGG